MADHGNGESSVKHSSVMAFIWTPWPHVVSQLSWKLWLVLGWDKQSRKGDKYQFIRRGNLTKL